MNLEDITAELISVDDAQLLSVHKVPGFFSADDIKSLLAFKQTQGKALGTTRRDKSGVKALDSPW
jgi:hypothetical protein